MKPEVCDRIFTFPFPHIRETNKHASLSDPTQAGGHLPTLWDAVLSFLSACKGREVSVHRQHVLLMARARHAGGKQTERHDAKTAIPT